MLHHPDFDPIALRLGPLAVHWYGLMYLMAFALAWWLGRWRIRRGGSTLTTRDLEDVIFYGVLGVVVGGRLGYTLFYQPGYYLAHPVEVLYLWQGGMAFHGGLLGVLAALAWWARRRRLRFLAVGDQIAPLIPLGLALVMSSMVFAQAGDGLARHPSQLYQAGLEGVALFVLVWVFARKTRPVGQVSAVFLLGYGVFRFAAEFAREPDDFLGLLAAGLSMGQWLSLPMVAAGVVLYAAAGRGARPHDPPKLPTNNAD